MSRTIIPIGDRKPKQSIGFSLFNEEDSIASALALDADPLRPNRSGTVGAILRGVYELRLLLGTMRPIEGLAEEEYKGAALRAFLVDADDYSDLAADYYNE